MKTTLQLGGLAICLVLMVSCKNQTKTPPPTNSSSQKEMPTTERTGQAFIKNDEAKSTVLSIAEHSKDHTILTQAIHAASLENALVNAGPLMVFAPTDKAFKALPKGTIESLLKPENKSVLANILKYHVTPGNYSQALLKKFKRLGQANNQYVKVTVVDGTLRIGGAKILASIPAGNGIVHVIDKVLLPPKKDTTSKP